MTATEPAEGPPRSGPGLKIAAGFLAAAAVGLAVATGFVTSSVLSGNALQDRESAILSAAKQETINVLNVDYKTAQQSSTKVLAGATGQFKDQWGGSYAPQFLTTIVQNKSVQTVSEIDAALVSSTGSAGSVIVSVTSVVTNPTDTTGVQRDYRITLQLQKHGGKWLVSTFGLIT